MSHSPALLGAPTQPPLRSPPEPISNPAQTPYSPGVLRCLGKLPLQQHSHAVWPLLNPMCPLPLPDTATARRVTQRGCSFHETAVGQDTVQKGPSTTKAWGKHKVCLCSSCSPAHSGQVLWHSDNRQGMSADLADFREPGSPMQQGGGHLIRGREARRQAEVRGQSAPQLKAPTTAHLFQSPGCSLPLLSGCVPWYHFSPSWSEM